MKMLIKNGLIHLTDSGLFIRINAISHLKKDTEEKWIWEKDSDDCTRSGEFIYKYTLFLEDDNKYAISKEEFEYILENVFFDCVSVDHFNTLDVRCSY